MIGDYTAVKTLENNFADWESHVFGYGYGTGEEHTLKALMAFMTAVGAHDTVSHISPTYDYQNLERALTPTVAWLLINTLCRAHIIEYGTSPRHGWLTDKGRRLRDFVLVHTLESLIDMCCEDEDYIKCHPYSCNCGPYGYEIERKCANPFW